MVRHDSSVTACVSDQAHVDDVMVAGSGLYVPAAFVVLVWNAVLVLPQETLLPLRLLFLGNQ